MKPTYPKRYVRLISVIQKQEEWPYKSLNSNEEVWVLEDEEGEQIRAKNPGRSGGTPIPLKAKWWAWKQTFSRSEWKKGEAGWYKFLVEHKIVLKFYQRPQDGGRWWYRHMGQ